MKLENGRPENTEGRLEKEIRVYDFLDKLGVEYQRVDHEAAMTMEACEEIDRTLGDGTAICKNLFLCNRQETDFYLLLMPGDKPFFRTAIPELEVIEHCIVLLCKAGVYGEVSGYYTGICQRYGTYE
jgi:hypothetical protein